MLALIAPKYFADGESVLHNACLDISNWPSLQAGECIDLSLLDIQFQTYIPSLTSANLQQPHSLSTSSSAVALNQENDDLKMSSPDSTTSNDAKPSDTAIATTTAVTASANLTNSTSDDDVSSGKNNDNQTSDNNPQRMTNKSKDSSLSREDILDSYKQSKEMLLAQKLKKQPDSPCDSNSSKSTGANNSNDYENENDNDNNENDGGGGGSGGNEADVDLDDYFDGNYSDNKVNESANTHVNTSTNIERPLRSTNSKSKSVMVLSSATEIDIFRSLYTVLSYTHLLWELVLTAEPIVVMATSPSDCSHMVQSLMR